MRFLFDSLQQITNTSVSMRCELCYWALGGVYLQSKSNSSVITDVFESAHGDGE